MPVIHTTREHRARRFESWNHAINWAAANIKGWPAWRVKELTRSAFIIELRPGEVFVAPDDHIDTRLAILRANLRGLEPSPDNPTYQLYVDWRAELKELEAQLVPVEESYHPDGTPTPDPSTHPMDCCNRCGNQECACTCDPCPRCEETWGCECTAEELEQHECFEESGHCRHKECFAHHALCCWCGAEMERDVGPYDTLAEKELDEEIDRYNESRLS